MEKRTFITAIIENISPLFIGDGSKEMLIDAEKNEAYLPATSLVGAFRSYLESAGINDQKLFGTQDKIEKQMSQVFVSDSFALIKGIERRDGVRIDKKTGSAVDGSKIERVYLGAGMEFPLKFEISSDKINHKEHKKIIYKCLKALNMQVIRLGGQKTSGLGLFRLKEAQEVVFNLDQIDQWHSYLLEDLSGAKYIMGKIQEIPIENNLVTFKIIGEFTTPLLIKGPQQFQVDRPDDSHIQSDGKNIIPGSSLKGVLRSRVEKIANHFGQLEIATALFGELKEKKQLGKFYFNESIIKSEKSQKEVTYNRIKMDKFTSGVLTGALMNDQPILGTTEFNIAYQKQNNEGLDNQAIGLMAMALRDLGTENLTIGGGSNIGRGVFKASKMVISNDLDQVLINFDMETIKNKKILDKYVDAIANTGV